jgi:MurNAc alpha-1-phosphate uridylyltransferase
MRAMILCAGRGERMRPLTDRTPKPLLTVAGKSLVAWHIERLVAAGIADIVINHAWLGGQIEAALGDGSRYGARLRYSPEAQALETAGGIKQALPLLGEAPFLAINGDIWCDWPLALAAETCHAMLARNAALWLLMADNPPQHPEGDFALREDGLLALDGAPRLTYAGIALYTPALFDGIEAGVPTRLAPLLRQAIAAGRAMGGHHRGDWVDVGTPQRLAELDARIAGTPISER